MIYSSIISLSLTIIIELIVSIILGIRSNNDIKVAILVNICTNPVVVYIANILFLYGNKIIYNVVVTIMEILVIIVEYILYKKYLKDYKKSAFVLSLINNIISYSFGLIMTF